MWHQTVQLVSFPSLMYCNMNKIRTILRVILWAVCVLTVGHSAYKLIWTKDVNIILEEESETFPLPSVTICPQYISVRNGIDREYYGDAKTLTELYEKLPSVKEFVMRAALINERPYNYKYVIYKKAYLVLPPSELAFIFRPSQLLSESWNVTDFLIGNRYLRNQVVVKCSSFDFNITSVPTAWNINVRLIISQHSSNMSKAISEIFTDADCNQHDFVTTHQCWDAPKRGGSFQ